MNDYKNAICYIETTFRDNSTENEDLHKFGTGFFVKNNEVITCRHNLFEEDNKALKIEIYRYGSKSIFEFELYDFCVECDIALLRRKMDNDGDNRCLNSFSHDIQEGQEWKLFGFSEDNTSNGETLTGVIQQCTNIKTKTTYDVDLNPSTGTSTDHAGLSGSPVLNKNKEVIAIFAYQNDRFLQAISIKKCSSFLNKNGIKNKSVSFGSFEEYREGLFKYFRENIRKDCEDEVNDIVHKINPQTIVRNIKTNLFFPEKEGISIDEIIEHIKTHQDCCEKKFWQGWLQLLTYVQILNGDYSSINNIQLTLNQVELKNIFSEMKSSLKVDLNFIISFFFVETEFFFRVAQKSLRNAENLDRNNISIFNSQENEFDLIEFTQKDKSKIIPQIANPSDSGIEIPDIIHVGVIPLRKLSKEVANSECLEDAKLKLTNLIEDAIK